MHGKKKDVLRDIQELSSVSCLRELVASSAPRSAPQKPRTIFLEESLDKQSDKVTFVN